ncbi:MAG TPA: hypothetical protein VD927_06265 [Chryseosolibacter sp.]|nr:hypothetical protein [Chryseosolibacter sp.]
MEPYEIVKSIMITFAIAYLLMEIVLNLNDVDNDTSNIILLQWSKGKLFIIPFALGAIGGHLFLGTRNPDFKMVNSIYPVLILFAIAVLSVAFSYVIKFEKSKFFLTSLLVLGILYGHFFWSMNYANPVHP